jgi:hypothetical protein
VEIPLPRPRNPLSPEFNRIRANCAEIMQSLHAGGPVTPR